MEELVTFVDGFLLERPDVPRTLAGSPKLTPIREALLASAELGPRARAQEAAGVGEGASMTYNQLRLVLAARQPTQ